jgi:hypothetical protein
MKKTITKAISNQAAMLAPHLKVLRHARALVAKSEEHARGYRETLRDALQATYELTLGLLKADTLQAFVEGQDRPWGKVAQERPFQPVVAICFAGSATHATSLSKYATVLAYAQQREIAALALADWIEASGIDKLAAEARTALAGDHDDDWFEESEAQHLQRAADSLATSKLGAAITISANDVPALADAEAYPAAVSFRRALVRVNGSKAELVRLIPSSAADVAQDLLAAVPAEPKLAGGLLKDKEHYELFRAADIFLRFARMVDVFDGGAPTKKSKVSVSRAGLLFEFSSRKWRAQTTSTASSFPVCEFEFDEPLSFLDRKSKYLVEAFGLREFATRFRTSARLSVGTDANDDLQLKPFEAKDGTWRSLMQLKPLDGEIRLRRDQLVALGKWQGSYKRLEGKPQPGFPKLFQPFIHGHVLWLVFPGHDPNRAANAKATIPPNGEHAAWRPFGSLNSNLSGYAPVPNERWLARADMQALADLASDYGLDAVGQFVDGTEDFAALRLRWTGFGISLPLAISLGGDLAQIAK